ncbi:MAG: hypothetical protein RIR55_1539 [Bacteroidota bacterium]
MLKGYFQSIISYAKKSIGLLLFLLCSYAIYNQVLSNENSMQYQSILQGLIFKIPFYQWFVLLLLMALNFLFESIKWRIVVSSNNTEYSNHSISFLKAVKGVLVGQTFAFFTPNRIGEYAGRTLFLEVGNKLIGVSQLAWSSYAQLLITIIVGSIALTMHIGYYDWINGNLLIGARIVLPITLILSLVLFFYKYEWKGRLHFLNILQIQTGIKLYLLSLSFFRYLIFLLQYAWVAYMLQMQIDFISIAFSVAILFLFLSILPTISITELVVRGQLLLLILAPFYHDKMIIISLSSIIWGINFLLPSIIGAILLLGYRLNR